MHIYSYCVILQGPYYHGSHFHPGGSQQPVKSYHNPYNITPVVVHSSPTPSWGGGGGVGPPAAGATGAVGTVGPAGGAGTGGSKSNNNNNKIHQLHHHHQQHQGESVSGGATTPTLQHLQPRTQCLIATVSSRVNIEVLLNVDDTVK
jgi:hypothetical protein